MLNSAKSVQLKSRDGDLLESLFTFCDRQHQQKQKASNLQETKVNTGYEELHRYFDTFTYFTGTACSITPPAHNHITPFASHRPTSLPNPPQYPLMLTYSVCVLHVDGSHLLNVDESERPDVVSCRWIWYFDGKD